MHNCSVCDSRVLFLEGPASTVVILIGILGNAYSFRLLLTTSINTSMLVSLSGLAVWDMLLLLGALLHHSIWASLSYFHLSSSRWDNWQVSLNGLHECAHITSTWMLIEVSAERFIAVTRPFHILRSRPSNKERRKSYARFIGGLIRLPLLLTFLAFLITLPCAFEYSLEPCLSDGIVYEEKVPTWLLSSSFYKLAYRAVVLSLLKTFGPFVLITLLTLYTVKSLRASMDNRAVILMEQGQDSVFFSDKDKTRSLQTISVLLLGKFLLLRCWPTAVALVRAFVGEGEGDGITPSLGHFLLLLNSASNSFVFVVLKSAFESRRIKRVRMRQREMVARHAQQVLWIGKALATDRMLLLSSLQETSTFSAPSSS